MVLEENRGKNRASLKAKYKCLIKNKEALTLKNGLNKVTHGSINIALARTYPVACSGVRQRNFD